MMVGLVKKSHQTSTAKNIDTDSILAQAAAIMNNADAVLAATGYEENVLVA